MSLSNAFLIDIINLRIAICTDERVQAMELLIHTKPSPFLIAPKVSVLSSLRVNQRFWQPLRDFGLRGKEVLEWKETSSSSGERSERLFTTMARAVLVSRLVMEWLWMLSGLSRTFFGRFEMTRYELGYSEHVLKPDIKTAKQRVELCFQQLCHGITCCRR